MAPWSYMAHAFLAAAHRACIFARWCHLVPVLPPQFTATLCAGCYCCCRHCGLEAAIKLAEPSQEHWLVKLLQHEASVMGTWVRCWMCVWGNVRLAQTAATCTMPPVSPATMRQQYAAHIGCSICT